MKGKKENQSWRMPAEYWELLDKKRESFLQNLVVCIRVYSDLV